MQIIRRLAIKTCLSDQRVFLLPTNRSIFSYFFWGVVAWRFLKKMSHIPIILVLIDAVLAVFTEIIARAVHNDLDWVIFTGYSCAEFILFTLYFNLSINWLKKSIIASVIMMAIGFLYGYYLISFHSDISKQLVLNVCSMFWILSLSFGQWSAILKRKDQNVLVNNLYFWISLIMACSTIGNYLFWVGNNFFEKDEVILKVIKMAYPSMNILTNLSFTFLLINHHKFSLTHG